MFLNRQIKQDAKAPPTPIPTIVIPTQNVDDAIVTDTDDFERYF